MVNKVVFIHKEVRNSNSATMYLKCYHAANHGTWYSLVHLHLHHLLNSLANILDDVDIAIIPGARARVSAAILTQIAKL